MHQRLLRPPSIRRPGTRPRSRLPAQSARMDGRLWPPERDFRPRPACTEFGRPRSSASWCRVSCLTRLARTRERSPSGRARSRPNSSAATARFRTESPRNSSRSLWSAEKLRWVSARCSSNCGSVNECCKRRLAKCCDRHPSTLIGLAAVLDRQGRLALQCEFPSRTQT
jgi:hypothetical protein